jgi:hypothetical protein
LYDIPDFTVLAIAANVALARFMAAVSSLLLIFFLSGNLIASSRHSMRLVRSSSALQASNRVFDWALTIVVNPNKGKIIIILNTKFIIYIRHIQKWKRFHHLQRDSYFPNVRHNRRAKVGRSVAFARPS